MSLIFSTALIRAGQMEHAFEVLEKVLLLSELKTHINHSIPLFMIPWDENTPEELKAPVKHKDREQYLEKEGQGTVRRPYVSSASPAEAPPWLPAQATKPDEQTNLDVAIRSNNDFDIEEAEALLQTYPTSGEASLVVLTDGARNPAPSHSSPLADVLVDYPPPNHISQPVNSTEVVPRPCKTREELGRHHEPLRSTARRGSTSSSTQVPPTSGSPTPHAPRATSCFSSAAAFSAVYVVVGSDFLGVVSSNIRSTCSSINPFVSGTRATTNPLRYSNVSGLTSVHRIGEIWANILHNVYASLVAQHGWSATARTNPAGTEGNIVFLHLFLDALRLQPCNPTFVTARAAWIQADANRYNGANRCLLWRAFASRGLGVNASGFVDNTAVPSGC
ncbi:hypothetical protein NLJ89_g9364 [Agrocybe chaxingu]|uniref:Extracellular metalloproteinase n=1 Tax=Agrocybe chaxingu TaxID=84603 RepID=A0A9W8K0Q4_9AGAR|nr:hypothetical protein NLJ89_g9364 [Agrocybe chaxingu]